MPNISKEELAKMILLMLEGSKLTKEEQADVLTGVIVNIGFNKQTLKEKTAVKSASSSSEDKYLPAANIQDITKRIQEDNINLSIPQFDPFAVNTDNSIGMFMEDNTFIIAQIKQLNIRNDRSWRLLKLNSDEQLDWIISTQENPQEPDWVKNKQGTSQLENGKKFYFVNLRTLLNGTIRNPQKDPHLKEGPFHISEYKLEQVQKTVNNYLKENPLYISQTLFRQSR